MTEKEILIGDLKINYKVFGAGEPFLILHGWGSRSDKWQRIGELLSEKGILAIVPDLPGFSKSQTLNNTWNLNDYCRFVKEFVKLCPEIKEDFNLLGHSFGGALSIKFSVEEPQRIKKLFLVAPACFRKITFKKKVFSKIARVVRVLFFSLPGTVKNKLAPSYNNFRKAVYKILIRKSDYPYVKEEIMKKTFSNVVKEDISFYFSYIKIPTVIIFGDKDNVTPKREGDFINKRISNSKLIVIPEAGHDLNVKTPEILAENILNNLK